MDIVFTSCDLRVRKKTSGVKRVRRLGGRKKRRSISRGWGERVIVLRLSGAKIRFTQSRPV